MKTWGWILPLMLLACHGPVLKVEMQDVGKNLLANGGFAADGEEFVGWEPWEDGYAVGPGRRHSPAVRCRNEEPLRRGIGQRVVLNQARPTPLLVSGWSKASEVSGGRDSDYSLYVDLIYADGEEVWGQHAPFDTGTHGWQEGRLLIRPAKPIRELSVYGLFRGHTGEAWEFASYLGEEVRGMGKLLFGNAVPDRFAFLAPAFDIMGTESNWLHGEEWRPPADGWFNFRRAMCYQKPYLLLMNTDYDRLAPELVEKYFQRCLFYGFFPSMFSHNAAENPYWQTPRWYERDRHLFKRYIPLIKQVAEAGWEPVTGVRSAAPEVWVERFGPNAAGEVFITLFNSADGPRETELQLFPEWIGPVAGIRNLLDGKPLEARGEGDRGELRLQIEAEQVQVLVIENR